MLALKIGFCAPNIDPAPWLVGLHAAMPQATVSVWQPGDLAVDAALVWQPPQVFFDQQPRLRAVFSLGAGVDALLRLRLPPGCRVFRLEDAGMAVQMAEYVAQGVARQLRGLAQAEADLALGHWAQPPLRLREDCTVGLLGLGVLGRRVAQVLQALDYPVLAWRRSAGQGGNPSVEPLDGLAVFTGADGLDALLARSQVLVNLLPLTPETENLLDAQRLGRLPRGAYLINVARGAHVVDADLIALVRSGHLSGALLDVFRTEPLSPTDALLHTPGITCTPHVSARTLPGRSLKNIVAQVAAWAAGQPVAGEVDRKRGY
ncbi:MAG: glyoxylate/hydroxypyruvate reductase A [Rhodoferax sp.]